VREDLQWFKKHERKRIFDAIDAQLKHEPTVSTRNRKRTRPGSITEWELRVGEFRVFYNVDDQVRIVEIKRVGEKRGNLFFFRGKEEGV
jgi:mRNA-degrading endonuclease RelE of RelBE toxin-antitoxin system